MEYTKTQLNIEPTIATQQMKYKFKTNTILQFTKGVTNI